MVLGSLGAIVANPRAGIVRAARGRYFQEEHGERIGNMAAGALLNFFLADIAPAVYNLAIAQAQERLQARVAELDIELQEDAFTYWTRRAAKR